MAKQLDMFRQEPMPPTNVMTQGALALVESNEKAALFAATAMAQLKHGGHVGVTFVVGRKCAEGVRIHKEDEGRTLVIPLDLPGGQKMAAMNRLLGFMKK